MSFLWALPKQAVYLVWPAIKKSAIYVVATTQDLYNLSSSQPNLS